jgi:hypothetical protein
LDAAEAERRWDDLVSLHAAELAEAAQRFFEQYGALLAAIERAAAALDNAQAGTGDPVRERLTATLTAPKSLTWMGLVSEGRIAATLTEREQTEQVEFRLAGEEWRIWRPDLADPAILEAVIALLGSIAEQLEALSAEVGDGSLSVDDAVARFATIMGEFEAQMARLKSGLVGEEAAQEAPPPAEEEPPPVEEEPPPATAPPSQGIGPAIG